MTLWNKGKKADEFISGFTVGNDYLLDQKMVKHDAIATIAHAATLQKAGILSEQELSKLKVALKEIISLLEKGNFIVKPEQEDSHTAIEEHLTQKLGNLGKKIHAGRSRNDQVIAMTRLYSKEKMLEAEQQLLELCKQILVLAEKHEFTPMPGYTHTRKAMPSSVGLWASSFAEQLLDSLKLLEAAFALNNQCPLGAAAGFGSALPLDRAFTAKLLGFDKVQNNVFSTQHSRGKIEAAIVSALSQIMLDLAKASQDMIMFSMPELGFFSLPGEVCTGSSIMPQKHNPDVLELVRAKSKKVNSMLFQLLSISAGVGSSYHRDLQLTKRPLIDSLDETIACLKAMQIVFAKLKVNKENCTKACTSEIFAADKANEMVLKGVPFREAYQKVASQLDSLEPTGHVSHLKSKKMHGAPGSLGLANLKRDIEGASKNALSKEKVFSNAMAGLL